MREERRDMKRQFNKGAIQDGGGEEKGEQLESRSDTAFVYQPVNQLQQQHTSKNKAV